VAVAEVPALTLPRSFRGRIVALATFGLALRLMYVLALSRGLHDSGDSDFFHRLAVLIGDGRGFVEPLGLSLTGAARPTALHPPLYPLFLGAFSAVGVDSYLAQRVIGCFIGFFVIVCVGLLGRRVGGDRVGLIAAGLAAVYPVLIAADGAVMSESLYGLLVVVALLCAYRLAERPSAGRAAVLGAVIALAALTRAEALALLVLALVPAAVMGARRSGGRTSGAWRPVAAGVLACVVVLAPWTARNWHVFGRPILISNNSGTLLAGANCDTTYRGPELGSWNIYCVQPSISPNEALAAADERSVGLSYAGDHLGRVPAVLAVRLLRTFDLYQPGVEARRAESRSDRLEVAGAIAFWVLLPVGVWGALLLRRRRQPLVLLLAPFALAVAVSLVGYGIPRFRHPADLALVVLAAVAYEQLLRRRRRPSRAVPQAG
jgi:4-amino-4-deoxy-L-arabinose transferase-like glycosyltransferase